MSNTKSLKKNNKSVKMEPIPEPIPEPIIEDEDNEDDESDEDNNEETDDNEDNNEETDDNKLQDTDETEEPKAEKKQKKIFEEAFTEISNILDSLKSISVEIKSKEKEKNELEKKKNDLDKQLHKLLIQLPKVYSDDINKARKEKKPRAPSVNGILKLNPVPPVLIKFLGLNDNELLQRPKVMSLLNEKFKTLGLKQGQTTILDKKTAKIFGLNEGHEIKFTEFQTFLKNIYDSVSKTEVEL